MGYTESYSEIQNYKHCYLNGRGDNDVYGTDNDVLENIVAGTANDVLETIVEETFDQDDDETEVDAALEDQSLADINESGMSVKNQVMYTEVKETNIKLLSLLETT